MTSEPSDPQHESNRPSLAAQMAARFRRDKPVSPTPAATAARPWVAPLLALLIVAGPLATLVGAKWLGAIARRDAARLDAQQALRREAERARMQARDVLGAALARPGPATLLDGAAAALPKEDMLARAALREDGTLELEVVTSDPDALRSALRRVPALAPLRDVRQREGEGRTRVLLRGVLP
ncbi:hypothetical protein [uncultured Sphingomonas sp.]|uniref:hypothetical protein n=1 Tax=uncultured Sphingomonas sp. TaxID=158754 RepID=UPI0025FD5DB0|nr:hypothetical protein [uncultured Sphingomonas sp.]